MLGSGTVEAMKSRPESYSGQETDFIGLRLSTLNGVIIRRVECGTQAVFPLCGSLTACYETVCASVELASTAVLMLPEVSRSSCI